MRAEDAPVAETVYSPESTVPKDDMELRNTKSNKKVCGNVLTLCSHSGHAVILVNGLDIDTGTDFVDWEKEQAGQHNG